ITGCYHGVLTGKGLPYGGSLARTEATGFGLVYIASEALATKNDSFEGKTVLVSGSGNVAIYAVEKAKSLGAKVVAMSDSNGYIYDKNGVDIALIHEIKEGRRGRIREYVDVHPEAEYHEGCKGIWTIPCDFALPCATQNEIDEASAKALIANGCMMVAEGANMPSTLEAQKVYFDAGILFLPAKASNAGGVAVSALEMSQNSMRLAWTFEEVDEKLHGIMKNIFRNISDAAEKYGRNPQDYVTGANVAGFLKVAGAMMAQGYV
ncbi:MAG: NADP-specific glutamate dehydrogenase, partial [Lachnospiraceae bacterium]|nr:NADP-specific glutamate dehydrogenase [Lachnospiraceae bacterium]